MKICTSCKISKPFNAFSKSKSQKSGYNTWCKQCLSEWRKEKGYDIERTYGITKKEYNEILVKQENKCSICNNELDLGKGTHLDHEHETGYSRGILCTNCNKGLGFFKDDINIMARAIAYIIGWQV